MRTLLLLSLFISVAHANPIFLKEGELKTLKIPSGQAIKITNGRVLGFKDQGSKIIIFGKKAGESFLQVGNKGYEVFVLTASQNQFHQQVLKNFKDVLGLRIKVSEKKLIVEGELHRWSDWQSLAVEADKSNGEYTFNAEVDEDVREKASRSISSDLVEQGLSQANISWLPTPVVTISSQLKSQKNDYDMALKKYGLKVNLRKDQIALAPTVQIEVVMAELVERVDREFGLEWSPFGEFQVLPQASLQTSLTATLKAMEKRGLGKILATPRILSRSGSEAEFHSGGEFPIPVTEYQSHYKSQNIIWKKHGIVLKFKPMADHQGRLSLKVYAELSVLSDQQAGGVPALMINKIESEFDLAKPQTVALSGLIRQDWHRGKSGLPWLSQIPVLSSLFSSQSYLNRKTELVVFVTPKIISDGALQALPKGWSRESF